MYSEEKKRYKAQFIIFRSIESDAQYLSKEVMIVHENELKHFNQNDWVDNYIFVVSG